MPAVACGTNTCSSPSSSPCTNAVQSRVRSCTTSREPVRTSSVSDLMLASLSDPRPTVEAWHRRWAVSR